MQGRRRSAEGKHGMTQPIVYSRDRAKIARRGVLSGIGLVLAVECALIVPIKIYDRYSAHSDSLFEPIIFWTISVGYPTFTIEQLSQIFSTIVWSVFYGWAVLAVCALVAPIVYSHRQRSGWLALDGHGLVLNDRAGRHGWGWPELCDIRLRSRFHPGSLLFGRAITARAPDDDRRRRALGRLGRLLFSGPVIVIGNDYPVPAAGVAERIEAVCQAAPGSVAEHDAPEPSGPDVFRPREKPAPSKLSEAAMIALIMGVFVFSMAFVFTLAAVIGRDGPELTSIPDGVWIFPTLMAGLIALLVLIGWYFLRNHNPDFVSLDSNGLRISGCRTPGYWRWADIAQMQLMDSAGGDAYILAAATHDIGTANRRSKPNAAIFSIDDVYDVPLPEILDRLLRWRHRGLALSDTQRAPEKTASPRDERRAHVFHSFFGSVSRDLASMGVLALSLAISAMWTWYLVGLLPHPAAGPGLLLLVEISLLIPCGLFICTLLPQATALRFDESGLVHTRAGYRRRWTWDQLGPFKLQRVERGGKPATVIVFTAPRDDWLSRLTRRAYGLPRGEALIVIEDIYTCHPAEIARRLNDRRASAVPVASYTSAEASMGGPPSVPASERPA